MKPRQTLAELRSLQRLAGSIIMSPLARDWRMQRTWTDHRPMRHVTAEFIKPNDRLTSFERIEIYNKQYWFRLFDTFIDDFPGLKNVLGHGKFMKLARAYLTAHPSRSFTLRNLGSRLIEFMEKNPRLLAPRKKLALDMAKFEWARITAFDGPAKPALSVDDLLGKPPTKLRLGLQPYLVILQLDYPLDDYAIRLKKHALRGEASNAVEEIRGRSTSKTRRPPLPRPEKVHIVVHRHDNSLYYKHLDPQAHTLLTALAKGQTVHQAVKKSKIANPEKIRACFESWSSLGWFCAPTKHS
jgi:hypothetical protein